MVNDYEQTAALMINNHFGAVQNMLIENNRFVGGGYTIYTDARFTNTPIIDLRFINNRIGRGKYGYTAYFETASNITWTGNDDDVSGALLAKP